MSTRGIDIRQTTSRILFRVSLKDSAGDKVTTGTTELRLYRLEDDGTLDVYDWTTNDFVAPGSGTPDDETTMTHQVRRDSTGADVDSGIWTAVLSTLTNFTAGNIYIAQVTNTGALPESQEREFQFGSFQGDGDANATQWAGGTIPPPNTAGYPMVDLMRIVDSAADTIRFASACNAWTTERGLAGTALPPEAADAPGGIPISDAGGLDMDALATSIAAALADTNELQTDWANGGRLDTLVDTIVSATLASAIRTAIGLTSANLDTQIGNVPTNAEQAAADLILAKLIKFSNQ